MPDLIAPIVGLHTAWLEAHDEWVPASTRMVSRSRGMIVTDGRNAVRSLLAAAAVVLAVSLIACAPSTDDPATDTPDRPSIKHQCSLISADELSEVTGLTVQRLTINAPGACSFTFAALSLAEHVSLF
jgi:hypothetical protein